MLILLLIFIPLLASILCAIAPQKYTSYIAIFLSVLQMALSVVALNIFQNADVQNAAIYFDNEWIASLGARFTLSFAGKGSLLMILLTSLVFMLLFIFLHNKENDRKHIMYSLLFGAQFGISGVFLAQDTLLFYLFWEVALVPVYFLSSMYGAENRIAATFKFFVYTFTGSLLMLVAFIYLHSQNTELGFSLQNIHASFASLAAPTQLGIFILIFIAFAIKMPIFPFHTWQPFVYQQSNTAVTIIMSALMVKMGVYGILQWLPHIENNETIIHAIMYLSVIGVIYASCIAWMQDNIKKLVAYSSIAHIGMMSAAIFSNTEIGTKGSIMQMLQHGINIAGMWFLVMILENRLKTQSMKEMGGIAKVAPKFAIVLAIISFANIALPLTNGFPGEFMMLNGIFQFDSPHAVWLTLMAGSGVILSAVYTLGMINKVALGNTNENTALFKDLTSNEVLVFSLLILLIFILGIYPQCILQLISTT